RNCLGRCLTELGGFTEAIALEEEAVRIAETINVLERLAAACRSAAEPYLRKGDFPKAIALLERGLGLCRAGINPRVFPVLAAALGVGYVLAGRASEALPLLEQAVEPSVLLKAFQSSSPFLWVSEAYLLAGHLEEASQCARRALEHAREHHERGNQ